MPTGVNAIGQIKIIKIMNGGDHHRLIQRIDFTQTLGRINKGSTRGGSYGDQG